VAGSNVYTVGTAPTLLASAPPVSPPGPVGWFLITNGGTAPIYLMGGTANPAALGPTVAAGATQGGWLFRGDSVFGITQSGSATSVGVLQTGV
jgi:hypothetical protein